MSASALQLARRGLPRQQPRRRAAGARVPRLALGARTGRRQHRRHLRRARRDGTRRAAPAIRRRRRTPLRPPPGRPARGGWGLYDGRAATNAATRSRGIATRMAVLQRGRCSRRTGSANASARCTRAWTSTGSSRPGCARCCRCGCHDAPAPRLRVNSCRQGRVRVARPGRVRVLLVALLQAAQFDELPHAPGERHQESEDDLEGDQRHAGVVHRQAAPGRRGARGRASRAARRDRRDRRVRTCHQGGTASASASVSASASTRKRFAASGGGGESAGRSGHSAPAASNIRRLAGRRDDRATAHRNRRCRAARPSRPISRYMRAALMPGRQASGRSADARPARSVQRVGRRSSAARRRRVVARWTGPRATASGRRPPLRIHRAAGRAAQRRPRPRRARCWTAASPRRGRRPATAPRANGPISTAIMAPTVPGDARA